MHQLADHIMRQEQASGEISRSVGTISDKAKKLREEIISSLSRLVKAEEAAIESLTDTRRSGQPTAQLIALVGEAAAWKRRAAATLVGINPPSSKNEVLADRHFTSWMASVSDGKIRNHPAFTSMQAADETAHTNIRQMMREVERHDYGSATQSYMKAEGAIDEMIKSARQILATLGA